MHTRPFKRESEHALVYEEWALHLVVVEQVWSHYGRASVDLFCLM